MSTEQSPFVTISISIGELIDRITILELKSQFFEDPEKAQKVNAELTVLRRVCSENVRQTDLVAGLTARLRDTNRALWDLENRIRKLITHHQLDSDFAITAAAIVKENDARSALKQALNKATGSINGEEKYYA